MSHNCPADWLYYPLVGCYQSQQDLVMAFTATFVLTVAAVMAILVARRVRRAPPVRDWIR